MTKKKPKQSGNKKQPKCNKKVKTIEEKTKKLTLSNETEHLADIEQNKQEEEINDNQINQNNEHINTEIEVSTIVITEEETEETDKGDGWEMKEVTKRHGRKDNNPKNQKPNKNNKKAGNQQDFSTGKSQYSRGDQNISNSQHSHVSKGKQNNKQDNISENDYSRTSKGSTEELRIPHRGRSTSGNRGDQSSSTKQKTVGHDRSTSGSRSSRSSDFRNKHQEDENTHQDRSTSRSRQDYSNSSKNTDNDKGQKTAGRDRSTSKHEEYQNTRQDRSTSRNRQDHSNSSKNADNYYRQKTAGRGRSSFGNQQDYSNFQKEYKTAGRGRNSLGNQQDYASSSKNSNFHKEYKESKWGKRNDQDSNRFSNESDSSWKQKNSRQFTNKSDNRQDSGSYQTRQKNSYQERSRSRNRQSHNETTQDDASLNDRDNWEDLSNDSSVCFPKTNTDTWTSQNQQSQNSWYADSDDWITPQQHKSRDSNRKSSNLNETQIDKSNKRKDVDVGQLFDQYSREFSKAKNIEYHRVKETFGDLFEVSEDYSLGHCVAEDMGMGSGIAVQFRQKFKQVDDLLDQRQKQGGLAVLKDKDRFIYYLVTKQVSNGKPTYQTLFKSLYKMKQHMIENGVKKLALPKIGCGLDRLEWDNVKYMLEFLFRELDIDIIIYNFQQDDESTTTPARIRNCKVVHERYPIDQIDNGTLIIYLSSEDGEVTEEMENLDKKFRFLGKFRSALKRSGDVIYFDGSHSALFGCIVKKTKNDLISFKSLNKCISKINGENKKLEYNFVGFQAIDNQDDEIINNKIINILRNTLRYVDIYVCYPEKLQHLMPPSKDSFY